jgi:hypothetical protein
LNPSPYLRVDLTKNTHPIQHFSTFSPSHVARVTKATPPPQDLEKGDHHIQAFLSLIQPKILEIACSSEVTLKKISNTKISFKNYKIIYTRSFEMELATNL